MTGKTPTFQKNWRIPRESPPTFPGYHSTLHKGLCCMQGKRGRNPCFYIKISRRQDKQRRFFGSVYFFGLYTLTGFDRQFSDKGKTPSRGRAGAAFGRNVAVPGERICQKTAYRKRKIYCKGNLSKEKRSLPFFTERCSKPR